MSVAGSGLDSGRVAQLRVEHDSGVSRRGSGYRVGDTAVLTAAHVVAGARGVRVVFNADLEDEWSVLATVALCAPAGDVAVLTIDPPGAQRGVEPARFGQIGRRAAVLSCRAVGFPRFKLRTDLQTSEDPAAAAAFFRDAHQADGTIASLSNWREGTLEITVAPPERDPDPSLSPWEGMSGAAVWCADRIVGVVSRHHRTEGLNRLAAVRASRWYDQLDPDQESELQRLVGLPRRADQLEDVIPPEPGQPLAAAYTEYIEDIAPVSLQDREQELAEWTAFCAGDEYYAWWQAGPWAGKTAMASWFALHPPVGVTVVSFFITRRLAGQADSIAFTEALIEQLTAITGEPGLRVDSSVARDGQRRRLPKKAATQAAAASRRLLLLVDGLDEDEGVPPAGPSSIAALLPRRPIAGLQVLVTSRQHPGLPHDVAPEHPLRQFLVDHPLPEFRPQELAPSALGERLKVLAKAELTDHLRGSDQLAKDLIGYLAAAGGGLTVSELRGLTRASFVDLHARLGSVFGRSLRTRLLTDVPPDRAEPVYLFAHETLRELADQELGSDLGDYRELVHRWADTYHQRRWPADTPRYLGRPYSRLLTRIRDLARLVQLVIQPERHDRMLAVTFTDAAALAEITDTQQLLLDAPEPDLTALALIAVERYRLSLRNDDLPVQLPALWVHLGQPHRAEQLARSITDPARQAGALTAVAKALAAAGQPERAEQLARSITDPARRAGALIGVAQAWVAVGQPERAEQLARSITKSDRQMSALTAVAKALAAAGQPERAEQLARSITDPARRAGALIGVAKALAAAGQPERAEQLARSITDPARRAGALIGVAKALAAAGQPERAEQLARSITDPARRAGVLTEVAQAWVAVGQPERAEQLAAAAEQLARSITDPARRAGVLTEVAQAWVAVGQPERAEQLARSILRPYRQATVLTEVAQALAAAGQPERAEQLAAAAEQLARSITGPVRRAGVLTEVAQAWVAVGQPERAEQLAAAAEQLARSITGPVRRAGVLTEVAQAWVAVGQPERAEQLARSITGPARRAGVLTEVAQAWVAVGQPERAEQLAAAAEQLARSITDPARRAGVLTEVAQALAAVGQPDRAEQLARSITDPARQAGALTAVAQALVAVGQPERAEQLARSITDPARQAKALTAVAQALAAVGQPERAEQLARSILDPARQAKALTAVAKALAAAGQPERAEQLARSIPRSGPAGGGADRGRAGAGGGRAARACRAAGPQHHGPGPAGGGADRGRAGAGGGRAARACRAAGRGRRAVGPQHPRSGPAGGGADRGRAGVGGGRAARACRAAGPQHHGPGPGGRGR